MLEDANFEQDFERTFSDRITCVRVIPLDEDFATALQLPLCSDDEVLSML